MGTVSVASEKRIVERNLDLMKTLDDAWNAGPKSALWETFRKRHTENVAVYWPGGSPPTMGRHNHDVEAVEFFKTFPDNHLINNPYKVFFGQGDYTCTVADFSGTMKGPMKSGNGKVIQPTNRRFQIEFCTIAHWSNNGEILEERLFYDLVGLLKQIGVTEELGSLSRDQNQPRHAKRLRRLAN